MGKIRSPLNRVIGAHFCVMLACLAASGLAQADSLCTAWLSPSKVGDLNTKLLDEASGMAISRTYPRLYLVNDSGSGPSFVVSDRDGSNSKKITIEGFKPFDTEDLALGPCPSESGTCLVIGDIGDNRRRRSDIELVFIAEELDFGGAVKPVAKIKVKYPDGAHNAEALGALPSGDLIIVTKEEDKKKSEAQPAQIFRLPKAEIDLAIKTSKAATLERLGDLDVPAITKNKSFGGLVTGMSITAGGERWMLLTYEDAIEVEYDQAKRKIGAHKLVPLVMLPQQEAVAYENNDRDILYTTELLQGLFARSSVAPVMGAKCKVP